MNCLRALASAYCVLAMSVQVWADFVPLDPEFKRWLIDHGYDSNSNDVLEYSESQSVTSINLDDDSYTISDLGSISSFPNLNTIEIDSMPTLTNLLLDGSSSITTVNIWGSYIELLSILHMNQTVNVTLNENESPIALHLESNSGYMDVINMQSTYSNIQIAGSIPFTGRLWGGTFAFTELLFPNNSHVTIECYSSDIAHIDFGEGSYLAYLDLIDTPIQFISGSNLTGGTVHIWNPAFESASDFEPLFSLGPEASLTLGDVSSITGLILPSGTSTGELSLSGSSLQWADLRHAADLCQTSSINLTGNSSLTFICIPDSSCELAELLFPDPAYLSSCQNSLRYVSSLSWITELDCSYELSLALETDAIAITVDSIRVPSAPFELLTEVPQQILGQNPAVLQIGFNPPSNGEFNDTIEIFAQTDISNTTNPQHHIITLEGSVAPRYPTIDDLQVSTDPSGNVYLDWSPVNVTLCGSQTTPDYYLVFYSEGNPYNPNSYYFLAAPTTNSHVHALAARFSDRIAYRVEPYADVEARGVDWMTGEDMPSIFERTKSP